MGAHGRKAAGGVTWLRCGIAGDAVGNRRNARLPTVALERQVVDKSARVVAVFSPGLGRCIVINICDIILESEDDAWPRNRPITGDTSAS